MQGAQEPARNPSPFDVLVEQIIGGWEFALFRLQHCFQDPLQPQRSSTRNSVEMRGGERLWVDLPHSEGENAPSGRG